MLTNLVITAYCSCTLCCGPKATGVTASGHRPTAQHTVAASRQYPFGTILIINGVRYTVEDRLARRYDSRVDIFMPTHRAALKYGIHTNQVEVILPRNGTFH